MGLLDRVKGMLDNNPEIKENLRGIGKNLEGIGNNVGNIVDNLSQNFGGKVEKDVSEILRNMETKMNEMNPNVYKFVYPPEVIAELRKDLGVKLQDNHAELIKSAIPGIRFVEAEKDTDFSYVEEMGYSIMRTKEYKTNKHVFLCLREDRKG